MNLSNTGGGGRGSDKKVRACVIALQYFNNKLPLIKLGCVFHEESITF